MNNGAFLNRFKGQSSTAQRAELNKGLLAIEKEKREIC